MYCNLEIGILNHFTNIHLVYFFLFHGKHFLGAFTGQKMVYCHKYMSLCHEALSAFVCPTFTQVCWSADLVGC